MDRAVYFNSPPEWIFLFGVNRSKRQFDFLATYQNIFHKDRDNVVIKDKKASG